MGYLGLYEMPVVWNKFFLQMVGNTERKVSENESENRSLYMEKLGDLILIKEAILPYLLILRRKIIFIKG